MRDLLLDDFAYDRWANARTADALRAAAADDADDAGAAISALRRARGLFSHLARAQAVWLGRVCGTDDAHLAIWQDEPVGAAAARADAAARAWTEHLAGLAPDALTAPVHYANSKGTPFTTPLHDIAAHVVAHGAYHRGQIALLLRDAGAEPPLTDRIAWSREKGEG